ncbi:MAG TPA: polyprenyl synthetase family protein [Pseudogracilibacillus sp.]|nr:polyprenyl synthetase family protein [Pseudogracilibacillus sp.]
MQIATLYKDIKKDIQHIERRLTKVIDADHPILHKASIQLLRAGGKRIRPVFALLCADFGDRETKDEQVKAVATALELIHMASLVHDDVVDDADLRRGKPTIKKMYDDKTAIYTGDYILACSIEEMAKIKQKEVHKVLAKSLVNVVEGEISQIEDKYNINQNLRQYLRRIKRKTALLIASSCKLGALTAGTSKEDANRLFQYGYNVGMSFQIIDDILDFTSTTEKLGKPVGNDLLQGHITLPVLFAMEDPSFKQALENVFHDKTLITEQSIEHIVRLLLETDAIEQSYLVSNMYLQKALKSLEKLENIKTKKTLIKIAHKLGERSF